MAETAQILFSITGLLIILNNIVIFLLNFCTDFLLLQKASIDTAGFHRFLSSSTTFLPTSQSGPFLWLDTINLNSCTCLSQHPILSSISPLEYHGTKPNARDEHGGLTPPDSDSGPDPSVQLSMYRGSDHSNYWGLMRRGYRVRIYPEYNRN